MRPEQILEAAGISATQTPIRLSGGDIGEVHRIGEHVVKTMRAPPAGVFEAEAEGLDRLRACGVRVPEVRWAGAAGLVIEWLGTGPRDDHALAEMIAGLHHRRTEQYGRETLGYIGRHPLPAQLGADWGDFWRTHRIAPLLALTRSTLGSSAVVVEEVLERVEPAVEGPVWVHGDLWGGNAHHGAAGPALIDPSVQMAERAVDLAMMKLFSGFGSRFWDAYQQLHPVPDAVWRTVPYHQLYFLLLHVHFFGAGYVPQTVGVAEQLLRD